MSTTGKLNELRVRLLLCVVITALGAWGGWHVGFRQEFPAAVRPAAKAYIEGYAAYYTGLCTRNLKPLPHPRVCAFFLGWNRDAVVPAVPASYREVAWSLWRGTRQILFRWAPGGAIAVLVIAGAFATLMRRDGGGWWLRRQLGRKGKWIRGARLIGARRLSRKARRLWGDADLMLAQVALPRAIEPYHFGLLGATGQGKSAAMMQTLDGIYDRGDRAILADADGEFLARYGSDPARGDLIWNPLDARSVPWSPLAEIRSRVDATTIACALIPDAIGEAAQWHRYAQIFLADVLRRAYAEDATNRRVVEMATITDVPVLRSLLANSAAARLSAKDNERMFGSVMAVVTTHITPLAICHEDAGKKAFSIRHWVQEGRGNAYFNYMDGQLPTVKYLIGAMLDIASNAILGLPKDRNRRIWMVLDEVASLGRIQTLESFFTRARKHGGCGILGLQSTSQLRELYGADGAQTILSQLSSKLLLAVNDPDTADYASRLLGEAQYARKVLSGGKSDGRTHANWTYQYQTERIVLASEISCLRFRRGYLTLAGGLPAAKVKIEIPRHRNSGCEPFTARDMAGISLADFKPRPDNCGTPKQSPPDDLPSFDDDGDRQP